jgi:hypothetical protein
MQPCIVGDLSRQPSLVATLSDVGHRIGLMAITRVNVEEGELGLGQRESHDWLMQVAAAFEFYERLTSPRRSHP